MAVLRRFVWLSITRNAVKARKYASGPIRMGKTNRLITIRILKENEQEARMKTVKHPCQGCIYYKVCGESARTVPCKGRKTKSEQKKETKRK